jgi:hypothetical protein
VEYKILKMRFKNGVKAFRGESSYGDCGGTISPAKRKTDTSTLKNKSPLTFVSGLFINEGGMSLLSDKNSVQSLRFTLFVACR